MLIIEGPDMLGKTTFARKLVAAVDGISIDKFGLPEASYTTAKEWLDRYDPSAIADRFVISEPIYGLICRGKTNTPIDVWNEIWAGMEERGGCHILVYVSDPYTYADVLQKRYDPSREAFSIAQCAEVNQAYWQLFSNGKWRDYHLPSWAKKKFVIVDREGVEGGDTVIVQPDEDAGRFAADWLSYHDERAILNHLWRAQ